MVKWFINLWLTNCGSKVLASWFLPKAANITLTLNDTVWTLRNLVKWMINRNADPICNINVSQNLQGTSNWDENVDRHDQIVLQQLRTEKNEAIANSGDKLVRFLRPLTIHKYYLINHPSHPLRKTHKTFKVIAGSAMICL